MNNQPLSDHDLELLQRTGRAASRHLDVPPTPRDTLAVLRQAAEQEHEHRSSEFAPWWARLAFAALLISAVLIGANLYQSRTGPTNMAAIEYETDAYDPGIDIASWNLEIETLMSEIDSSLDQLADGDSDLNNIANDILNVSESRL